MSSLAPPGAGEPGIYPQTGYLKKYYHKQKEIYQILITKFRITFKDIFLS
jgi:hypothetical protein